MAVSGMHKERVKYLLDRELSLYAAHIPLDAHREVGNNWGLAPILGLKELEPFGEFRGLPIGVAARGVDGSWRVKLFSDRGAIDLVRVLLFQDFGQLVSPDELNAPPLRGAAAALLSFPLRTRAFCTLCISSSAVKGLPR